MVMCITTPWPESTGVAKRQFISITREVSHSGENQEQAPQRAYDKAALSRGKGKLV